MVLALPSLFGNAMIYTRTARRWLPHRNDHDAPSTETQEGGNSAGNLLTHILTGLVRRQEVLSRPDRNLKFAQEAQRAVREEVRRDLGDTGGQIEVQMKIRVGTGCR
jgi:hypothetical protein